MHRRGILSVWLSSAARFQILVSGTSSRTLHSVSSSFTLPMDYNLTPRESPIIVTAGPSPSTFLTLTTNGFARTLNITAAPRNTGTYYLNITGTTVVSNSLDFWWRTRLREA